MQEGIHPEYPAARVKCACGNTFVTRSTRGDFQVDVCGACHPFYTGTQKLIDTAGRVDRFRKRYEKTAAVAASNANKGAKAAEAKAAAEPKVAETP
jgi:large subunit ribosomal protein L31